MACKKKAKGVRNEKADDEKDREEIHALLGLPDAA